MADVPYQAETAQKKVELLEVENKRLRAERDDLLGRIKAHRRVRLQSNPETFDADGELWTALDKGDKYAPGSRFWTQGRTDEGERDG